MSMDADSLMCLREVPFDWVKWSDGLNPAEAKWQDTCPCPDHGEGTFGYFRDFQLLLQCGCLVDVTTDEDYYPGGVWEPTWSREYTFVDHCGNACWGKVL